ncbi:N-acetyltransferase [Paenibacillus sambharensis]|uniref:N-acetyltransferase n=1 Tax=Paenibacillus sambharensis TaxID=1803190 RepID=A0A2W1LAT4_9BACL|nr:GNAT family protein [Paenibacillus sambharensis]PZD95829.1 N-acetyltransferase [Paenibacillus sambharensis]
MPRLIGARVMLREYRADDFAAMRRWVNDPEIVNQLSDIFLYPHTESSTESFIQGQIEGGPDHKGFVIADISTEAYIGQIDLFRIDWKNRKAELGIVIGAKELQGKGYGSEALQLLQDFVFNRLNLNRLQLEVYDYNEQAYACYRKVGFKEDGRLRQAYFTEGRYCDIIVMSLLREEYTDRQQLERTDAEQ